ncbi:MAG: 2-oxo acid dehydrogenase subunit E2 [Paracoccaceae bacterium]
MQGGSFTISNGGASMARLHVLAHPQPAAIGHPRHAQASRSERPVVVAGQIVIRPMMYLALSYDHRIVDGKGAVTFLVRVKEALEDPRRLLMDI